MPPSVSASHLARCLVRQVWGWLGGRPQGAPAAAGVPPHTHPAAAAPSRAAAAGQPAAGRPPLQRSMMQAPPPPPPPPPSQPQRQPSLQLTVDLPASAAATRAVQPSRPLKRKSMSRREGGAPPQTVDAAAAAAADPSPEVPPPPAAAGPAESPHFPHGTSRAVRRSQLTGHTSGVKSLFVYNLFLSVLIAAFSAGTTDLRWRAATAVLTHCRFRSSYHVPDRFATAVSW